MVITISIKKTAVHFEQWWLAPPMPQPCNMQQPYSCAEVDVTKTIVDGAI